MKKNLTYIILSTALLLLPSITLAQDPVIGQDRPFGDFLKKAAGEAGYKTDVEEGFLIELLGQLAFALMSLLGVFFITLVIYGGYRWMFARGNEEEVKKAMSIIKHAFIGLMVVLGSYGLWKIIQQFL